MKNARTRKIVTSALLFGILLSPAVFGMVIPANVYASHNTSHVDAGTALLKSGEKMVNDSCAGWMAIVTLNTNCIILNGIWVIDKFLLGTALNFATAIFDWSISYNIGDISKNAFVTIGWGIVRDITNLFFIFILLWIALATIFNIQGYGAKDLLAQLVIAALLINFSLAIGGFIVRFTNALGMAFYTPIQYKLSERLIGFTHIQEASTKQISAQNDKSNFCDNIARATIQIPETDKQWKKNYDNRFTLCMNGANDEAFNKLAKDLELQPRIQAAIYQALWLIIIIPIIAFVFLAGAVFFLIRYLTLSVLLVFAPIVFLLRILPDTKFLWNDWWNRFTRQAFFAPAFFFMLFLTVVAFDKVSNANVGNPVAANTLQQETIIVKEPPLLRTNATAGVDTGTNEPTTVEETTQIAGIGGIGTGLSVPEALAQNTASGATQQKGFFGIGYDMFLFVALMIMNLMVAQQAGIQLSGTVIRWGNKTAGWAGKKARGLAYRGAIRGAEPATTALAESRMGRALAQTPFFRGLTKPAVAIHEERERLDAERAKQVERAAALSPDLAWSRLKGESMGVKAAYAKSANPENIGKMMASIKTPEEREAFVAELHKNRDKYRIEGLDKKIGEAMKLSPEGLTLRAVAKSGKRSNDANFGDEVKNYLDSLTDREFGDAMTPNVIRENQYARQHIAQNFKNERRVGQALLGTPEKINAFRDLMEEAQATTSLTDPTAASRRPAEIFADIMRRAGNTEGAHDIMTSPIIAVLGGAGVQPFVRERRRRPPPAPATPAPTIIIP